MRYILFSTLFLTSCASLNPLAETELTEEFADRAIEVNDAYYAERNAQILVNILRARDRLPRRYTALSDLKVSPQASNETSVEASELGLGNTFPDPWIKLGGSRTQTNTSNLELAVSPKVSGANSESVFRSAVPAEVFEYYYNSGWGQSLVRMLMVDGYERLYDSGTTANKNTIDAIKKTQTDFTVYSLNGELFHCFEGQCATRTVVLTTTKTFLPPVKKKDSESEPKTETTTTDSFVVDLSDAAQKANVLALSKRKIDRDKRARLNRSDGFFLYCSNTGIDESAIRVPLGTQLAGDGEPKSLTAYKADKYECSRAPSGAELCTKRDTEDGSCSVSKPAPVAIFWLKEGNADEPDEVFQVRLRAIDDIIYFVGSTLRGRGENCVGQPPDDYEDSGSTTRKRATVWEYGDDHKMSVCSTEVDEFLFSVDVESPATGKKERMQYKTFLPIFALAKDELIGDSKCARQFAAKVVYSDGVRYLAGPPQIFGSDFAPDPKKAEAPSDKKTQMERVSDASKSCRFPQKSGSVLTLIAELIETVEVTPVLPATGVILR